jgi:HSP20 family protein
LRICKEKWGECLKNSLEISNQKAPKELAREYQTPEGEKVREIGPIVYGYSMTIGQDGNPM